MQFRIDSGDAIDQDLQEIALDFMGWLPSNPYGRLAMKTMYATYDYYQLSENDRLNNAQQTIQMMNNNPEAAAAIREMFGDNPASRSHL
jgi:hypothetical protein